MKVKNCKECKNWKNGCWKHMRNQLNKKSNPITVLTN